MKISQLNEDYLDSAEFRIQRYEDDIPELFHKIHDGYMSGMVNAKAYAEALHKIYDALEELDYEDSTNESLVESKNSYSYKNYTIFCGLHGTDRWYIKDGNDRFVGSASGYSSEEEAIEYIDKLISTFSEEYDDNMDDLSMFEDTRNIRLTSKLFNGDNAVCEEQLVPERDNSKVYMDNSGVMGTIGSIYSEKELKRLWDLNKDSDPSMEYYKGDFDAWFKDTVSMMSDFDDTQCESLNDEFTVGKLVTHVDDGTKTRGIIVKRDGNVATVRVGDKDDYIDVDVSKLQLDEGFDQSVDLDRVAMKVANLLDLNALGENNWIEFDYDDARTLTSGNKNLTFKAIGETKTLRGHMTTRGNKIEIQLRNGSEAMCTTVEGIARFIAGEFDIAL